MLLIKELKKGVWMPKFRVSINLDIPAESADKAAANLGDFMSCVLVQGKPIEFTITDVQAGWYVPPQEE